jgi:general stress protein 26
MKKTDYTKDKKGIQKVRQLLGSARVFMMATNLEKIPFSVCPMTLQEMDEKGDLWFFTPKNSDHFKDIERDNRVQLLLVNENQQQYLSIYGNAAHVIDEKKLDRLWNPMLRAWFNGKEDPNLALLNINMESAYYWNSDQNKLVSLYHLNEAARTGNHSDMGEKGHINLQQH